MKKIPAKKSQILTAAQKLFWKYGIRKVTTEELCQEAGVSKMTFYKYFRNKINVAVVIFKSFANDMYAKYDEMMAQDISFADKLEQLILLKLKAAEEMSLEFVRDVYGSDIEEIKAVMDQMLQRSLTMTEAFLEQGKKAGSIRKDLSNQFILFQLNQVVEMMRNEQLLTMFDDSRTLTRSLLDFFFYGIMNPQKETQ